MKKSYSAPEESYLVNFDEKKKTRRQQTYRGQQKRLKIRILNPFH